jgi:cobalt-zinc-cadmium efflux system membrane fusion protein
MQRIIYNTLTLSALLILFSCGHKETINNPATKQTEIASEDRIFVTKAQFEHSKMILGSLEEKAFPVTIKATGMIDVPPENRAVVNATMGGYIKTTPLLIGDKVRKGQVLVTIENPEFVTLQQKYLEVNGQLTYLEAEYERQKTMRAENITSEKRFLEVESTFKTAKARHNGLRKQLQMLNISPTSVEAGNISTIVTIHAPISGSIAKVNVTKGTYVSPATAILEIVNNEHLHLELSVFEKDIMKLKKGQRIDFKIPESSTETYKAEVHLISSVIEENRTINVHGHLEDVPETNFLIGMFVEAQIVTGSTFAKAVPETAIVSSDDNTWILKLAKENEQGYYFDQIRVELGNVYDGYAAITKYGDLKNTDKILTKGAFNLIASE